MKPTLLILAAGMGSRYGGLKQLDALGPNGETIMDFSVSDAIAAGFGRVVFVIRKSIKDDFEKIILPKYKDKIEVDYVFQELDALPAGFTVNPERVKPYGTGHAILTAKDAVKTPFAVINADDFYGRDAFATLAKFLNSTPDEKNPEFAMVGYQLSKTLSENGTVARGVCKTDAQHYLTGITEMYKIQREVDGIIDTLPDGSKVSLAPDTPVSMNCWGFTPLIFTILEEMFVEFLKESQGNPTLEFPIPSAITYVIDHKIAKVKVLESSAEWFGVTYKEDKEFVMQKLRELR